MILKSFLRSTVAPVGLASLIAAAGSLAQAPAVQEASSEKNIEPAISGAVPKSEERQVLNKQNLGITEGLPLQASSGGIEELRQDVQRLMDIEAIKQLKYAYFRCLDTANLEEMATLFHDDVSVHFKGGTYEWKIQGKKDYLANIGKSFSRESVGQHNAHHPEIQMLSDTEATGLWYLADNMWILNHNRKTHGTALYWDRYLKVDGKWLIKDTNYERVYEINDVLEGRPNLSSHYLGVHGPEPQF